MKRHCMPLLTNPHRAPIPSGWRRIRVWALGGLGSRPFWYNRSSNNVSGSLGGQAGQMLLLAGISTKFGLWWDPSQKGPHRREHDTWQTPFGSCSSSWCSCASLGSLVVFFRSCGFTSSCCLKALAGNTQDLANLMANPIGCNTLLSFKTFQLPLHQAAVSSVSSMGIHHHHCHIQIGCCQWIHHHGVDHHGRGHLVHPASLVPAGGWTELSEIPVPLFSGMKSSRPFLSTSPVPISPIAPPLDSNILPSETDHTVSVPRPCVVLTFAVPVQETCEDSWRKTLTRVWIN